VTGWWLVRRRLSSGRLLGVLVLLLLTLLVRYSAFAGDPLGLLLGFGGVATVVFGLVWGFVTGGSAGNEESPGYPRDSRLLLWFSRSLLALAALAWAALTRSVEGSRTLAELTARGSETVGVALLLGLVVTALAAHLEERPRRRPPDGAAVG
jgi:hypothetical protein